MKSFRDHIAETESINEIKKLPDIIKSLDNARKQIKSVEDDLDFDLYNKAKVKKDLEDVANAIATFRGNLAGGKYWK